ncbi:hypothetical protein V1478_012529 [Vespula squamosa]|uniref:Uncharacterized protein n=1 Tax=Vespula squamosa TaxID=30214 RepID=A0ABD2ADF6_VESSQ
MMMVDACGSAATETVASISSHVTRVSMYFAVGIGCLPLKESLEWNANNTTNQDDIGDRHHGSNGNPRNYFPVAHCSGCFLRRNDTKPLASILADDKWNRRKESSQDYLTLDRAESNAKSADDAVGDSTGALRPRRGLETSPRSIGWYTKGAAKSPYSLLQIP